MKGSYMGHPITILVGTMTGTAEIVADDITPVLEEAGHAVTQIDMEGLTPEILQRPGIILICTSTYGEGDVPDNAQSLYAQLQEQKPDLSTVRYGVIGLGDAAYEETFNFGGKRFDEILSTLGATRIGTRMIHNASSDVMPEDMAVEWAREWLAKI